MEEKSSRKFDSSKIENENEIETKHEKPLAARLGEGIFCIIYLVYTTALVFIMKGKYDAGIAKVDDLYLIPEYGTVLDLCLPQFWCLEMHFTLSLELLWHFAVACGSRISSLGLEPLYRRLP